MADATEAERQADALKRVIEKYGGVAAAPVIRWVDEGEIRSDEFAVPDGQIVSIYCPPRPGDYPLLPPTYDPGLDLSRYPTLGDSVRRFKCRKLHIELRHILFTHYEHPPVNILCVHYRDVTHTFNVWLHEEKKQP